MYVVHHGAYLSGHDVGTYGLNGRHAERVLNRYRRYGRRRVTSKRRHCLDVGLYAGTAAAVAAGNGENRKILLHSSFFI